MSVRGGAELKGALPLQLAGEEVWATPGRALFWPATRALFVADLHLGKGASFRAAGVPIPPGTTEGTLLRLEEEIGRCAAERLIILGDLSHARSGMTAGVLEAMHRWRERHRELSVTLVLGNHDRKAGALPQSLRFDAVEEPHDLPPFRLRHVPSEGGDGERYGLAGHLHPVAHLRGKAGQRARVPCFRFGPSSAVLPAFGEFTGGAEIALRPGDRVVGIAGGRTVLLA
jgi:uncharacterized protein